MSALDDVSSIAALRVAYRRARRAGRTRRGTCEFDFDLEAKILDGTKDVLRSEFRLAHRKTDGMLLHGPPRTTRDERRDSADPRPVVRVPCGPSPAGTS